ncbi:MAG: RNA-binding S4 domain-containing protein [Hyphomicrobiaceae bacterium]
MTPLPGEMGSASADADDHDEGDDEAAAGPVAAGRSNPSQRLDKWLWFARIAKSRTLAATLVSGGKVRVNRAKVDKPAHTLRPGDVVTIALGPKVRVLRVVAPGVRRGPATEAQGLFDELTEAAPKPSVGLGSAAGVREAGTGRPTKRERRQIMGFKGGRE